jgi:mono/diheme cytochrome c family protein
MKRLTALGLLVFALPSAADAGDERELFETQVRPLLANNCWSCHRQSAMGGLRLDARDTILKGGRSGPAVIPGKPGESLLILAVTHRHERIHMPPGGKLRPEQIATLTDWVRRGAYWPEEDQPPAQQSNTYVVTPEQRAFWSFQPVRRPVVPEVHDRAWARSAIDRFVLARLEKEGMKPVRFAGRRTLIRRVSYDLTGLPPSPEEVDAFLADESPAAFAKVVDRLLASPRYGERWGRYWLDIARYSDDRFNSTEEDPYPNAFRYRNWVIRAFNEDMPYDLFVKAQIAGDRIPCPDPERYAAGLGFFALSPEMQDDRVDAATRGFLGLTVACAQCHDHKFDPIPTQDFYSLEGIFANTKLDELPLAPKDAVEAWQARKKALDHQQSIVNRFYDQQREQLTEIFAAQTARYLLAAAQAGPAGGLDSELVERWKKYLGEPRKDHPFLKAWFSAKTAEERNIAAATFQSLVIAANEEKREVDEKNKITLGPNPDRSQVAGASLASLDRDKYILWRDLFERSSKDSAGFFRSPDGLFYFSDKKIESVLEGPWKAYLESKKNELARLKKELPEQYSFLQVISDKEKLTEQRVHIRGDRNNPGEPAPPRFLLILSPSERKVFSEGSGRAELAAAIADARNPLTARVIVNRIWQHHFGRGIVATPSNFGQLGARPTHPELLDYLASRLIESGWSVKAIHREILLSATYALASDTDASNAEKDPENRFLWRANRQRLDAEALRDSMLFVSGKLDLSPGGKGELLEEKNRRRTVYGFVSRRKLDGMLALFDFPNPNNTAETRNTTNVPVQRLFFMNSRFVNEQAKALANRFSGDDRSRIRQVYRSLFGRAPDETEQRLALEFVSSGGWTEYAQALLSSNEFLFVD